jgi:hypothetical protein
LTEQCKCKITHTHKLQKYQVEGGGGGNEEETKRLLCPKSRWKQNPREMGGTTGEAD